ncbi:hypothetical protein TNIN_171 [Trichonephila inaurata madagascariensis]|uniref:Transposase Tc1-like domain-containing protein n=1 Tax=Trichonephila inaurata madagascariensis TaxID=2747483 RepID=A0A8X7BW60_9ARAC|nr:hypothetical protein TNIN_171 [Trichonephila inaurata madagascariensis]
MRGNVLNKSRCGRPHKLSDCDSRAIVRKVKKNPKISAPKLADQIVTASGKKVHPETVRRILRSGGYNGRVSSRKPFISSVNQQKRLDFASPHAEASGISETVIASRGWFNRFKHRNNLHNIKITGEAASGDTKAAAEFPAKLKTIIEQGNYPPELVFNVD